MVYEKTKERGTATTITTISKKYNNVKCNLGSVLSPLLLISEAIEKKMPRNFKNGCQGISVVSVDGTIFVVRNGCRRWRGKQSYFLVGKTTKRRGKKFISLHNTF